MMCKWYYPNGNVGDDMAKFVDEYSKYIYKDSPALKINGKNIMNGKNEREEGELPRELFEVLYGDGIQSIENIKKIIEWKTGNRFKKDTCVLKTHYYGETDLEMFVNAIFNEKDNLCSSIKNNPLRVFQRILEIKKETMAKGIGNVYILTLIFFLSKGEFPIYDRFAHIACSALLNGTRPTERVEYISLDGYPKRVWNDYLKYCELLRKIFGKQNISREQDIALWVYGHCFNLHT